MKIYRLIFCLFILFLLTSCSKNKVYFDYNCGGNDVYVCNISNSKINCDIEKPKCNDKEFIGWYDEKEGGNLVDLNGDFNESKIIYAHYKEKGISPNNSTNKNESLVGKYVISFDTNGGNGGQKDSVNVVYGDKLPKISTEIPTRENYVFMGWYDNKDYLNGIQYYDSKCLGVTNYYKNSNITLYAGWSKKNAKNYTITYKSNNAGNYTKVQSVIGGENTKLDSNTFTYNGYEFAGWNTSSNGKGTSYVDNSNIVINTDITLYAIWSQKTYTVKYSCGEGTGTPPSSKTVKSGQTFTTSKSTGTCQKAGYTFKGWNDPTGDHGWTNWSGTWKYANGQFGIQNNTLTLIAMWEPKTYSISFDCNGGSKPSGKLGTQTTKYGQSYTLPSDVCTRAGYVQNGWKDQKNITWTTSNTNNWIWSYDYNPTLKAEWAIETYTVTFDCNGGSKPSGKLNAQTVKYGQSYTLPSDVCVRAGYVQNGWKDQKNITWTTSSANNWKWSYDYSPTLKAEWVAKSYVVTFDCNGGSKPSGKLGTQTVKYGQSYTLPSDVCTRTGYTQNGWKDQKNITWTTSNISNWKWSYDYNPALKAEWVAKTYAVTFDCNGGSKPSGKLGTQTVRYGQSYTLPSDVCTRTGYTQNGWKDQKNATWTTSNTNNWVWSYDYSPSLKAEWDAKSYSVSFDCNGGSKPSGKLGTQTVRYGQSYTLPSDVCTRSGYVQNGWKDQNNRLWTTSNTSNWSWSYDYSPTLKAEWRALGTTVNVASFNLAYFNCGGAYTCTHTGDAARDDVKSLINNYNINIGGFQEAKDSYGGITPYKIGNISSNTILKNKYVKETGERNMNAILSEYAFTSQTQYEVNGGRRIQNVKVVINGVTISVYNTHLALNDDENVQNWQVLANKIAADSYPVIVTGDFNYRGIDRYNSYLKNLGVVIAAHDDITHNMNNGPHYMDSIFVRPYGSDQVRHIDILSSQTIDTFKTTSDHNMIVATLTIY